jgi:hypothetical protein
MYHNVENDVSLDDTDVSFNDDNNGGLENDHDNNHDGS